MIAADTDNRYTVVVEEAGTSWRARILDPSGTTALERACADEPEARLFASTVRQHIYWLSEEQFRNYYRLPEPE